MFNHGDRVKFVRTGTSDLEGKLATVTGIAFHNATYNHYIVDVDHYPTKDYQFKSMQISQYCLEKI